MSGSLYRRRKARRGVLLAFVVVAVLTVRLSSGAATLTDPCSSPGWNAITCENSKPGTPSTTWSAGGAGDTTLQGFATEISVDHGQTVSFKITDTNGGSGVGGAYHIDIYRVGYYQGNGARLQATISSPTATAQPACLTESTTGLTDCGNWSVSATWAVPASAVSGLYFANLVRTGGANSHIYFVVRDDERHAPILVQTSDETWQAYNAYGGNSLYVGTAPTSTGRAWKVSYNRPLTTGNNSPRNEPLYAEYPMIRFLERNGYDVSYFSDVDTARSGAEILNHKTFMSVGHDEYWSAEQRNNATAARNAGVNLAFFSGNEIFWKTRFAASISTGAQAWRTVVCYKESKETTVPIDPADPPTSTGAWRDPRFGSPADGAKPENALSGQIYMVDAIRDDAIAVPYAYSQLRFWNNTSIAHLTTGQTATLPTGTLGYEWDEDLDNGSRPAGLIDMSSTTVPVTTLVTDSSGQAEGSGNATHHLTLYRASSGALVFGSGTVQWSFGLDDQHTPVSGTSNSAPSPDMQQATVNLLADMGTQPATLMTGLVTATKSTDTTPPTSTISYPTSTTLLSPTQSVTVTGTAGDTGGVVAGVEVSTNGGTTWHPATGTTNWSYTFVPGSFGQITIESRATDDSANLQTTPASVTVAVGSCPCNIFGQTTPTNTSVADPSPYELGVKFRSDVAGFITGIRFYKGTGNTGTHLGHLWTGTGTLLGSATFSGETATGWQQVNFASPIAINPNTTYVASYFAPAGNYAADRPFFANRSVDVPPLHALADGTDGPNGVYASGGGFPSSSFNSSNYYVDVLFNNSNPPTVNSVTPATNATGIATSTAATVTFSQPMNAATISNTTFSLRDASNALVPATVTYDTASMTATLTPNAALALSTTYTATVSGGSTGVKNTSGTGLSADYVWSFTTGTPAACPCTIFPSSATPTITSAFDTTPNELGVKFRSDESGYIRGIRFYKGAGNTGTHVGHLWSSTGAMLAEITFSNETAGGWQQVDFPRPVAISANTTYVASYYAPNGGYALDRPYFGTGVDRSPLHGLADGVSGPNGVFASGGGFPTQGSTQANYWVDVVFDTSGSDTTPPIVSSVSPSAGATGIATSRTVAVAFNEPMDPLSVTTTSVQLRDPSNAVVPATVSYASGTQSAILTPSSPLALSTTYTLVVKGGAGGATDTSGNRLAADYSSTFVTGTPATCPCNLLDSSTPTVASSTDASPTEVGVKFRSDVDGYITGIRFYKGLQNTGTHVGHLWSSTGTMMGSATFTGETSTGWQQVSFSSPVAIRANTTYIASYFAPNGGYALDRPFYTSWLDRPPLHALAEGVEGSNGVYASGQGFPNQSFDTSASNYWVDPMFDTSSDHTPPTVTSTAPTANATGVFRNTTVNAVFSEALDPNSIGSSTFVLRNAANTIVPATVTYNAATTTATLTPGALLTAGATYSVTINGGSSGVKDLSGNSLASDFTWSFTISNDTTAPTTTIGCNTDGCASWFSTSPVTVTLSAADNAAGSGVDTTKYTIDGSDPTTSPTAAVYTAPFTVTTTTTIRYSSTDKAGNVEAPGSTQIRIDTTPPAAPSLSFGAFSSASPTGSTVFFNPAVTGGFTVTGTSADAESGIASINYPVLPTGWSGTGGAYTFAAGAADPIEPNNVTATNNAGLSSGATSFTVTPDATAPATTLTCNAGACPAWSTSSPVTLALNASDTGSGVAATYYTTDGSDPSPVHGGVYVGGFTVAVTTTVKFRSYDKVGNAEAIGTQQVRIDTTPPSAPAIAFGNLTGAALGGGVLWFNPATGGTATVTATSTDAESGVTSYSYPSLGSGWSGAAGAYAFSAGATDPVEPNSVTATNGAGLTSAPTSFTVTPDTTAPVTTATCNGGACTGWYTSTPVSFALSASDAGSGIDRILYSTDGSAPSLLYTTPLALTNTTTFRFAAYDRVGNLETARSQLVQVDTTAPTAPTLSLGGVTGGTAINGGILYFNPAGTGGFTVTPSSTDAESGVPSYTYPTLGSGWTRTGSAYSFLAGATDPTEPNNVTATNGAGLTSTPTSFTVNADATAPVTSATCNGGPCAGWYTSTPVSFALGATDAGSGIDRILYSTDGSTPSLLYTAPLTLTTTTNLKYAAYDRVGNLEATKTQLLQIDTTAPAAPSLALGSVTGAAALGSGTLYFNPGATGGFTVTPSSTDAESGVASYGYPSLGSGWTRTGGAYTFGVGATDPVEPNNVTATNGAGLTSAPTSFTVTPDTTAPATAVSCNGGACGSWFTSSPVTVTLTASDAGSGVYRILYSTDGSAPSLLYTAALSISSTTTVKYAAVDKVGNTEATKSQLVQIDTTAPTAPTLSLGVVSGGAALTSGTLYFNPTGTGGFTVTASSSDPESGVASYGYPSLGSGWNTTGNGAYTFTAGAVDPAEPNNVRAINNAGLASATTSFTVTADTTAPTTSVACNGGACTGWFTSAPVSVTLSATDAGSGLKRILYSTDGTAPSVVYSAPIAVSATTTVAYQAVDNVGNLEALHSTLVQVDTTAPSPPSLTFSPLAGTAVSGTTVYYSPAAAGSFNVNATSTDPESGIATYTYPSFGSGWNNTGGSYSFGDGATEPAPGSVTATDNAGLTSAPTTFNPVSDGTAPTTTIACTGGCVGWHTASPVTITLSATDGGSGVDRILYSTDGTAPSILYTAPFSLGATAAVKFGAYDRVGNLEATKSQLVQIDTTAPSAPGLTLGSLAGGTALTAGTLFFNPAGTGSFTVTPTSTDAESGVASYTYPSLGSGWTTTGNGAYTFSAGAVDPVEPNNVIATNSAGLTSAPTSFTVTADSTAPTTSATCNGSPCTGWYTSAPATVALSAADTGSGVNRILYSTDGSTPSTVYTSPISITSTTTVKFAAVDKVGNTSTTTSTPVQVDTTAPTAPSLSFSGLGGAAVTGGVLYFNPAAPGGFTVTGSSTDAQSGVDHYTYPSLGGGWSNSGGIYAFAAGATDPPEPNNVTATNGAGLVSPPTSFTVTADTSAPATTISCNSANCSGWYTSSPVSVTLNATDTGSGVARILYSTDGSAPSTVYTSALSIAATTTVKYAATDKVGNVEATGSQLVQVDATAPTTPSLALTESSPFEFINNSTLYYNPTGTNSAAFGVGATTGDTESGISKVTFPAIGGMTGGGDVGASPYQTSYSWTAPTATSGSQSVTARNNAGLTASASFTLTPDTSAPSGGSITYTDGYNTAGTITVATTNGSDAGAGLDTSSGVLQRDSIGLNNGTCGTFAGNWTTATSPDATLVSGTCYRYRYLNSDNVGNTAVYTSASVVKADSSAPSTPTLTLTSASATQFIVGSTIYYGTSSAGNFTVTATSSDAESGIKQLNFPAIAGMTGGGADTSFPYATTYNWTTSTATSGQQNVTATNNANLTGASAPFTVTLDNTAPTLSITSPLANDRIRTGAVLTPSVSDTGSGIKQVEFRYCSGTGSCNFSNATIIGTATSAPYTVTWNGQPTDGSYVIVARVTDNVGNATTTANNGGTVVTLDNTPPFTAVSLVGATASYLNGTTLYMANTAGAFTLHVDVLDPQPASGVKNVVFPLINSSGWTGPASTDTTVPYESPYSFGAGAAVPTSKTIVTSDNSGNTANDTITFVKDQTVPTVTLTAPASRLSNGATISATAADTGGSGVRQVEFRYCPGTTCTFSAGTTIGTATSAPYTVAWNSQPADGTYTIAVQATDNVGNAATDGTATVTVDNSAPTTTLSVVSGTRPDLQYFAAGTLYYNPAATGDFTLSETATDPAGVTSVAFPAIAQTGFNGTAKTATSTPYGSNAYTFGTSNATAPPPATVVATDSVGNHRSDSVLFVLDATAPTGGSISYPNGYAAGGSVTIATTPGTDGGAGVDPASGVIERQTAPLSGGTCGTFGTWATVTSTDTVAAGACAQYRYRISDRVGNQAVYTSANVVKSDTTAASAPALSFGSFTGASAVSSTVYYNPAAPGGFTVTPISTDAESGVASYGYPTLGSGWTGTSGAYTFTAGATDPVEPNNVTATNGAGLTSAPTSFTVTADSTAPATSASCNGGSCAGWFTSSPVSVTLNASDSGSGVDRILYSTDGSAPSTVYTGALGIAATTTVKFAALDKVGNREATESQLVQVDTTAPSAPSLGLAGLSGATALNGGVLFFNPAGTGGFTVTPSSTDGESGVASYSYPSLGSGWSTTAPGAYTFTAGASDPAEPNNVTATNSAGLTSSATSFTVTADTTGPTTAASCSGGCAGWHTTTPAVTLSATDGGAGVAGIVYSTDGSAPSLPYTGPITLTATATVRFAATDKVGNVESTHSQLVQVDTTAPSTPALAISPVVGTAVTASTVFYNPASAGSFTVNATSTDAESGVASYTYPSLGLGWNNSGGAYSFAAGALAPSPANVTATNNAGLTSLGSSFTLTADSTAPATTATCNSSPCTGWYTSTPVTFALSATDGGSGLDRILYSTDGNAPSLLYTTPLTITSTTTVKYAAYDRVGNLEATKTTLVQVDTTAPSTPNVSFGSLSGAALNGGVLFFNPTTSGGFTVTPNSTDAESGVASYGYPNLGSGWSTTGNGAYSFSAGATDPAEPNNITATNNAGLTSAPTSFTITADSTAPAATIACDGGSCAGWHTTSPVSMALSATDGGSGVDRILYSTDGGAPSTVYSGPFTIAATATVKFSALDKVGNTTPTVSTPVQIDTTAPTTPALSFSGLTNASASASTVYYRSAAAGGFTVNAASSDPESGVASYGYPSLGSGWNSTGGTYTFSAGALQPLAANNVTATNNAGLVSATAPFTILRDDSAPTTAIRCNGGACGTGFTSSLVPVTLVASDAAGSGVVQTVYTLDGSDPSPIHGTVYLGGFTLSSTATVKFRSYDAVGNEEAIGSQLVNVDTTPPAAPVLSISAPSSKEYANGPTLYYNPSGTNSGSFSVSATASDPDSGISKVNFPAIPGLPGGGDTLAPFSATYTWTATTTASGDQTVTAYNGSGLTSTAAFTLVPDTTAPSGGSISYPNGFQSSGVVTIATTDGSDGGAGIDLASRTLERQTAPLTNGSCQTFGAWTAVTSPDTVGDATCVRYRYRVSDRVGNQQVYTSTNVVKVDAGAPTTPTLSVTGASPNEYVSNTTLYYNPSGTNSGSFTVTAATSAASGIDHVTFPALSGITGGGDITATPYAVTYGWTQASTASGAQTVTARSNVGGSSTASFTVTPDTGAPTGQTTALVGGPWFTTTSISIATTNGSDAISGLATATALLERASATLTNGTCGTFGAYGGSYTSPDTTVASGACYRYRYSIADKVGNRSAPVETNVAMVDTSAPTAPVLAFTALNHASVTASTVFYNSNTSGAFTVGATATDPQSGVASTSFPSFGSGWTGAAGVYTFAAGAADPTEPNNVTATNTAGLTSTPTGFTVTPDADAPTGGSIGYTDGYRTTANVAITLANGSDALSGVDSSSALLQRASATMTEGSCGTFGPYTTIATVPTLSYNDTTVTSGNCYAYQYVVADKVGNAATWTTTAVAKIDTDAPTGTLTDPGANLRQTVNLASVTGDTGGSGVATVTYQRSDPTGWVTIPQAWDTTTGADGLYDLRVVVTDRAGNSTTSSAVTARRVDNTPPSATLPDPGANLRGTVTLAATGSDSGSGIATVTYQRSDPTLGWATILAAWDTTSVADGTYDLRVVIVDVAGNQAISTVTGRLVDNTAPVATMGGLSSAIRGTVTLGSSATDSGSGIASVAYERQPAGTSGWVATPAAFDTSTVADGDYDIHVIATDVAGNSTTSAPVRTHVDNTSPRPTSVSPANGAGSVSANTTVTATFLRAMLASSINATSFTLTGSAGAVPATVTYDSVSLKATLTPTAALDASTSYTAKLTTAVTAQDGASLYQSYTWTFSTGVIPPTVTAKTPSDGATGVAATVAPTATFSRAMDATTINGTTATMSGPSGAVATSVSYDSGTRIVTLTPSAALASGATYTVQLGSGIKSQDGVALSSVTWTFTTASSAPTVVSTTPASGATGVPTSTTVAVTFNRDMKTSTLTTSTITLTGPSGSVAATVAYDSPSKTATLTPTALLASGAAYTATVSGTVQAFDGVPMGSASTWTFTTTSGPEVRSTSPAAGSAGVSMSVVPTVQMSKALDAATVTTTNVKLIRPDTSLVPISVAYNSANFTITITPASPLDYSGKLTIRLETGITAGGVPLAAQFNSTFTTVGTGVTTRVDAGSATAYTATNGNVFSADGGFIGGTARTVTNTITGTTDPTLYKTERFGTWQYAIPVPNGTYDLKLHFVELTNTACNTRVFSVDVLNTALVNDISGLDIFCEVGANKPDIKTILNVAVTARSMRLKAVVGVGTPEIAAIEIIPHAPTASSPTPTAGATGVAVGTTVSTVFSQAMDATSLTSSTVTLSGPGGTVTATIAYDSATKTVTLTPSGPLAHGATYTARLDGTIRDSYGMTMGTPYTWTFTTG